MRMGTFVTAIALLVLPSLSEARIFRIGRRSASSLSMRRRLSISPLIAAPGTIEFDLTGGFTPNGDYVIPSTLRFTPQSDNFYLGHTEWGINADVVNNSQFSDHVTFQSTTAIKMGAVNFALAPQFTAITRGQDGGYRGGGSAVMRIDQGSNNFGATFTWTGATRPSDTNPAGISDVGLGYGRKFGNEGILSHFTAHGNVTVEKQTGASKFFTLLEGVEYQINDGFSVDISGQHLGFGTGVVDHQILVGLSWKIGHGK